MTEECTSPNVRCGQNVCLREDKMEGIIGTLEFYAPVILLGILLISIVYIMKTYKNRK